MNYFQNKNNIREHTHTHTHIKPPNNSITTVIERDVNRSITQCNDIRRNNSPRNSLQAGCTTANYP